MGPSQEVAFQRRGGRGAGWGEPCLLSTQFWVGPSDHCLVGSPHPPKPQPWQVSLPFHGRCGRGPGTERGWTEQKSMLSRGAPAIRIPPDSGKPGAVGYPLPTSTWQRRLRMGEEAPPSQSPSALLQVPSLARESENRDGSPGCPSPPHRLQRTSGAQLVRGRAGPGLWGLLLFAEGELLLQAGTAWTSGALSGRPARAVLPNGLVCGRGDTHGQGALGKGQTTAALWGEAALICTLLSWPR